MILIFETYKSESEASTRFNDIMSEFSNENLMQCFGCQFKLDKEAILLELTEPKVSIAFVRDLV